jgi:hypothetical protein
MRNLVRYPLSAAKISIDIMPFGFWLKPEFTHRKDMPEYIREGGAVIWWARWAWFQISYSRWV